MTPTRPPLRLAYRPVSQAFAALGGAAEDVLGAVCFGHPNEVDGVDAQGAQGTPPLLRVDMPVLDGARGLCEVWYGAGPLVSGRHGLIRYRQSEHLLFGVLELDEAADTDPADPRPPLQDGAKTAYHAVFDLLERKGHGAILRFWNYFPAINAVSHGMERYRQFNIGRQDAFLAHGRSLVGNVPAACALGSSGGGLQVAFLATHADVLCIENPRQVSAYHYPSEYGPRSPTFSRACLVDVAGRDLLFVSGTASIVGHQTLHPGDVTEQTRECLRNIEAILAEANRHAPKAGFRLEDLTYKVYLRHASDLAAVRGELNRSIGAPVTARFLRADICRTDLLVEIEAFGGQDAAPWPQPGVCV